MTQVQGEKMNFFNLFTLISSQWDSKIGDLEWGQKLEMEFSMSMSD